MPEAILFPRIFSRWFFCPCAPIFVLACRHLIWRTEKERGERRFHGALGQIVTMHDDDTEQPLTEHLVDQFAAYFVMTMLAFHLYGYFKKEYQKTRPPES